MGAEGPRGRHTQSLAIVSVLSFSILSLASKGG